MQPALPFAGILVPTARLMDVPRANICLHIPVAPPRRAERRIKMRSGLGLLSNVGCGVKLVVERGTPDLIHTAARYLIVLGWRGETRSPDVLPETQRSDLPGRAQNVFFLKRGH